MLVKNIFFLMKEVAYPEIGGTFLIGNHRGTF